MTLDPSRPAAINCTQCGAGLNVLGGGRVLAHVCGYCGAELDAQDDYRVLRQFHGMARPASPFLIGMEGEIEGVRFTIIGTIGRTETYKGATWSWVEHQVFSPTHGYAWLTWEDERVVFTRKIRQIPRPAHLSRNAIEHAEQRPKVKLGGETFKYYASGRSTISFVEGEFNWVPKLGDKVSYVSLMRDVRMLDILRGERETEYEISTLLDRKAVFASFGVEANAWPAPAGVHPLEGFQRSSLARYTRDVAFFFAGVSLIIAFLFWGGETLVDTGRVSIRQPIVASFEVTRPENLVEIEITANVNNSWAEFDAELTNENDEEIAIFAAGMEYYQGVEGGESWTEGSKRAATRLRLDAGVYNLQVELGGAEVDWRNGRLATTAQVVVSEGVHALSWLWGAMALFGLTGAAFLLQRFWHEHKRWATGDWSEE